MYSLLLEINYHFSTKRRMEKRKIELVSTLFIPPQKKKKTISLGSIILYRFFLDNDNKIK